ncbi:uncharacterized protein LOC112692316 [Sipha flava]|uniref:Uncharacterized protein LOC112692316 n=1 Tax=Sipha flava TaxID=143950 RepID=A0A8B8GJX7_9HEMI|nr:uncharacterized protein LOC112692316 [Sipha flava]
MLKNDKEIRESFRVHKSFASGNVSMARVIRSRYVCYTWVLARCPSNEDKDNASGHGRDPKRSNDDDLVHLVEGEMRRRGKSNIKHDKVSVPVLAYGSKENIVLPNGFNVIRIARECYESRNVLIYMI